MIFLNKVKKATNNLKFLDPLTTRLILCITLVFYIAFFIRYLPLHILDFLQSIYIRIVVLLSIIIILCRAPDVALFLGLAYLVTIQTYKTRISEGFDMPKDIHGNDIPLKKDGFYELSMPDNIVIVGKYQADNNTVDLTIAEGEQKGTKLVGKLDMKGRLVVIIGDKKYHIDNKQTLVTLVAENFTDQPKLEIVSNNADGMYICKTRYKKCVESLKGTSKYVNMDKKGGETNKHIFERAQREGVIPNDLILIRELENQNVMNIFEMRDNRQTGYVAITSMNPFTAIYWFGSLGELNNNINTLLNKKKGMGKQANTPAVNNKNIPNEIKTNVGDVATNNKMDRTKYEKNKQGNVTTTTEHSKNNDEKKISELVLSQLKERKLIPANTKIVKLVKRSDNIFQLIYCTNKKGRSMTVDHTDMNDVKVRLDNLNFSDECKLKENFVVPVEFNAGLVSNDTDFNYTSGCTYKSRTNDKLDSPCNAVSTFDPSLNTQGINYPSGYDGIQIGALVVTPSHI